jgi:uncharacterized protein (DUF58 family)
VSFTPRALWTMAVAALGAFVLPTAPAIGLVLVVIVAAATDAWLVRKPPTVEVTAPPILSRGVPSEIRVSVTPPTRTKVRLVGTPDVRVRPDSGTGGFTATVTALRRGTHLLPRPSTLAAGPLGLGRWYHRAGDVTRFVVYPDMPTARRIASEVRLGRFGDPTRRSRGPLGLGTELESIREYLPDDDIRQVNWRATARTGTPMSNTYRIEQEREVLLLVDSGRLMASPVGDGTERTRLDVAVDAAAAVASVADVVGDRVGLVAFDRVLRRRLLPRREGGEIVISAIHDLEPTSDDSDFELAFRTVAHNKRAFVLLLTDLLEETAARPLLEAMPILARHHAIAVAGVTDPAVDAALRIPAHAVAEAFRTAVAIDIEESRRSVATRLGGYGATVIDVAPSHLPRSCVAAYLRAKRRARL